MSLIDLEVKRCATPVTVTHFSWSEAGKLEQRVVTRSTSPTQPLSLPLTTDELHPNNPFTSLLSVTSKNASPIDTTTLTSTNPFLIPSNPFASVNGDNEENPTINETKIANSPKVTDKVDKTKNKVKLMAHVLFSFGF